MALLVARYVLADLLRSQRFIVPLFVYVAALGVLFGGDPGPAPAAWPVSALVLYPISAWVAITTANAEDPVARQVTVAAAGGPGVVARGVLLACLLADVVLAAAAAVRPVIPLITVLYPYTPPDLVAAFLAHIAVSTTGTAVGLLCARPVIERAGWSFLVAAAVVVITGVTPWLPPVGTAVKSLGTVPIGTVSIGTAPIGSVALDAALGVLLALAACVLSVRRTPRSR